MTKLYNSSVRYKKRNLSNLYNSNDDFNNLTPIILDPVNSHYNVQNMVIYQKNNNSRVYNSMLVSDLINKINNENYYDHYDNYNFNNFNIDFNNCCSLYCNDPVDDLYYKNVKPKVYESMLISDLIDIIDNENDKPLYVSILIDDISKYSNNRDEDNYISNDIIIDINDDDNTIDCIDNNTINSNKNSINYYNEDNNRIVEDDKHLIKSNKNSINYFNEDNNMVIKNDKHIINLNEEILNSTLEELGINSKSLISSSYNESNNIIRSNTTLSSSYLKNDNIIDKMDIENELKGLELSIELLYYNLQIISNIKAGDKISIYDNIITIDNYYGSFLKRWYYNDTRHKSIIFIQKVYDNIIKLIEIIKNKDYICSNKQDLIDKYLNIINKSLLGLENLKITYNNDNSFKHNIENIINKLSFNLYF